MEEPVRVRVVFDDRRLLSKPQRSDGLRLSWCLVTPDMPTIADLASHLSRRFSLHRTCPDGILLSMDGFVLPAVESSSILNSNDVISVRKRGSKLKDITGIDHDALPIHGFEVLERQPIGCSGKPLAIKEYENESGGYDNKYEEDANDHESNEISKEASFAIKTITKRKRKHSNVDLASRVRKKGKRGGKLKVVTSKDDGALCTRDPNLVEKQPLCHGDDILATKAFEEEAGGYESNSEDDVSDYPENAISKEAPIWLKSSSERTTNHSNVHSGSRHQVEEMVERNEPEPVSDCMRKFPSRSARRKKAKRKWKRELADSEKMKLSQNQVFGNNITCSEDPEKDQKNEKDLMDLEVINMDPTSKIDEEVIPIIVRPGHIRFEPADPEQSKQEPDSTKKIVHWNGITSKKKGQKWGREKGNGNIVITEAANEKVNSEEVEWVDGQTNFEILKPLTSQPEEGDVIVYRLVELSSSWQPELSPFRVGKISSYDPVSMTIVLVPVPKFPNFPGRDQEEENPLQQSNASLYKEDGSLEIDYPSLVDVRLFEVNNESAIANTNYGDTTEQATPNGHFTQIVNSLTDERSDKGWEEIEQAFSEKKAWLLGKEGSNRRIANCSSNGTWSFRAVRGSALGPTIALLRAQNGL